MKRLECLIESSDVRNVIDLGDIEGIDDLLEDSIAGTPKIDRYVLLETRNSHLDPKAY